MSLSSALNIVNSSFAAIGAQSSVIASNIANANRPGYSREIANAVTNGGDGVEISSVTREANSALLDQVNVSTSESASQNAISSGLATLARTVSDSSSAASSTGALQNGDSPAAMLGNLQTALVTYQASPSNVPAAQSVVAAAEDLAQSINAGLATVAQVRTQADQAIAQSVSTINTLLNQFTSANQAVVTGLVSGANIGTAEDARDSILTQLSQQVGMTTSTDAAGAMSIYTDGGVVLFAGSPRSLSFQPSGSLSLAATGNPVMVGDVPITGSFSVMPIQSGSLAGLTQLRDTIALQYGTQLNQIAGGLINAFAEQSQSAGGPALAGLFTYAGSHAVPTAANYTGFTSQLEVNPNVDPSQGGSLALLQNGDISGGGSDYVYNSTGAAGFTGRISQLASAINSTQSFSSVAGLGTSLGLSDYASSSVSWLQGQSSQYSSSASYQSSLVTQAQAALSNTTGVNLDTEMTNMLTIENSYTTTAKLLTTVNTMFQSLLSAA